MKSLGACGRDAVADVAVAGSVLEDASIRG